MNITEQTKVIKKIVEVPEQVFVLELSKKELIALAAILGPMTCVPDFMYKIYSEAEENCNTEELEHFYPQNATVPSFKNSKDFK